MIARLLLLNYLLLPFTSIAQQATLKGKVLDQNGDAVEFAEIKLLNDTTIMAHTLTEKDGSFALTAAGGELVLRIAFLGRELYAVTVDLDEIRDIGTITVDNTNVLETVTVERSRPVIEHDFDKLLFHVDRSPLADAMNGLEVLARTPRLQVNSAGELRLLNQAPLVMVNGRRLNLSGQDLTNYFRSLDPKRIARIEVQSVGSADTDAANSGGVVNIVLKGVPQGFTSTVSGSYTYRREDVMSGWGGISANYGSGKWNVYGKADYRDDNDYGDFRTEQVFPDLSTTNRSTGFFDGYRKNLTLQGGLVYYPSDKHELALEAYYNDMDGLYATSNELSTHTPGLSSISNNTPLEDFGTDLWYTAFNYLYRKDSLGSVIRFIAETGANNGNNLNTSNTVYTFGEEMQDNSFRFHALPATNYYTLQGDWSQRYQGNWQFTTGFKFGSVGRDNLLTTARLDNGAWMPTPEGQEDFGNRENILAGYFTYSAKYGRAHSVRAGMRVENTYLRGENRMTGEEIRQHYTDFFPSLFYGYTLKDKSVLSATYSRRIQRPSFRDLNPFVRKDNDFSYIMGNPYLRPQYTQRFELAYKKGNHSLSVYANRTTDVMAGIYQSEGNVTYYRTVNFGKELMTGAEHSLYGDLRKWLYMNMSNGIYRNAFDYPDMDHVASRFTFYNNTYLRFTLPKKWYIDVNSSYNSGFQNYVTEAAYIYYLDLSVQKNLFADKGMLKLAMNDVFDTLRDKSFSTYRLFTHDFYQKRITRSFTLMFTYTFSNNIKTRNKAVTTDAERRGRL
ncbi:TonB-dependent receptor [Parapedobacter sp. ISTM3]|uniref:outer membrane beta-barrel protein n=1 Tax=Parapedobacter sp. ISTM3 TaxID=2800130 RepID=UPI001907490D|nr:outer membrane beta-barrel protein [Parapedobacter sp. ISTM3]MBK1439325.1 TonB-dependent receptor [Parapedobacter sp. ISTM3]